MPRSAYWWRRRVNFGDELNWFLFKQLGVDVEWAAPADAELVMIGSVLEHLPQGYSGTVCGTGQLHSESRIDLTHARVLALRGKLTAERVIGLPTHTPVTLGDLGLLVPKFVNQPLAKYDLGIVPHWSDTDLAKRYPTGHLIDPSRPPDQVVAEIARCKRVISSSLHGLIVADAYGIPRQAGLFPRAHQEGGDFKFRDYASVYDETPHFGEMWRAPHDKVEAIQQELWTALQVAVGNQRPAPLEPTEAAKELPRFACHRKPRAQISLIVPFRDDGEHRARVWNWLHRYWKEHLASVEIVEGHDNGTPFSKAVAVNHAASRARGKVFVILDADAYMDSHAVQTCVDNILADTEQGKRLWYMPYDKLYRLRQEPTLELIRTNPLAPFAVPTPPPPEWIEPSNSTNYGHQYGAMMQIMPREAFFMVGGMDPRFNRGWGCTDEKTEILTRAGWKRYDQVSVGDQVLTLNHESGLSEWNPIKKVNVYSEPDGFKLLSAQTKTHSSLTTLNHRWPVIKRTGARGWETSESIDSHDRIPIRAEHHGLPTVKTHSDAFVELVAWLYTEGYVKKKSGSVGSGSVGIAQSRLVHPEYCADIESALSAEFGPALRLSDYKPQNMLGDNPMTVPQLAAAAGCGVGAVSLWCKSGKVHAEKRAHKWLINRADAEFYAANWRRAAWFSRTALGVAHYYLNAAAGRRLLAHTPDKVPSHEFVLSLTLEQLELFLVTSMKGDGAESGVKGNRVGSSVFEQRDERAAEIFAFAAILAGKAVSIRQRGTDTKGKGGRSLGYRMTAVNIKHRDVTAIGAPGKGASVPEIVHHDGIVWCPTTENGTWLARRNGKVYFTGNSEDAALMRALDTLYVQHEVSHNEILHLWHTRPGKDWKTRKWVGQVNGIANGRLAQRYGMAMGEPAFMRGLVDEHVQPVALKR